MSTIGTARNSCAASDGFLYQRRRPEKTLLYQLVSKHYRVCRQQLAEEGRILPGYVQREFEDYLKYFRRSIDCLSMPDTSRYLPSIAEQVICAYGTQPTIGIFRGTGALPEYPAYNLLAAANDRLALGWIVLI